MHQPSKLPIAGSSPAVPAWRSDPAGSPKSSPSPYTQTHRSKVGVLGVEPRLPRYKQGALTIKLYSHQITNLLRDQCEDVSFRHPQLIPLILLQT